MSVQTILVIGGTGFLGNQIAEALVQSKKFNVKVLMRKESLESKKSQIESLRSKGAEIIEGDVTSVEDLTRAAKGCDTIVSILGGNALFEGNEKNLIVAAKAAGVKRIVPSQYGMDTRDLPKGTALQGKIDFLEAIKAAGLDWTVILTGVFYEFWYSAGFGFDHQNGSITVLEDGNVKMSATLTADVAKFVPEILASPDSRNAVVTIAGEILTQNEAIKIFEEVSGKKFQVTKKTLSDCKKELAGGFSFVPHLLELVLTCSKRTTNFEGLTDNNKYPVKITSLKEWAKSLYKK